MSAISIHILVDKRNPRVQYIIAEMFERRMGLKPILWSDLDDFETQSGPKLNYSHFKVSEGIPSIPPSAIVFEKRVHSQEVPLERSPELRLFPIAHPLGFDPIAACFFMLTRYEEYHPHRKDAHDRFESTQSILIELGLHQRPVVEEYVERLTNWLTSFYPEVNQVTTTFKGWVTVDVDQLFAMKSKGLVRTLVSTGRDVLRGNGARRLDVILGRRTDPNELYDRIQQMTEDSEYESLFFFQVGEGSRFDVNNPPHLHAVRQRINEISLGSPVGIHPSYYSSVQEERIPFEIDRLREIVSSAITKNRQHYLRFKLPQTFHALSDAGITDDYSMGYHDVNGFRAGTCKPFKLFDIEREETLQITMHPSCWMDLVATRSYPREEHALQELVSLRDQVKKFGGEFITTWHPEVLVASDEDYSSWNLLERLLNDE